MSELDIGRPPPWLIPFCASCKTGVDRFTVHPLTQPGAVDVEAECHGKTEGQRFTSADIAAMRLDGKPIVMFKGPLRQLVDVVIHAGG